MEILIQITFLIILLLQIGIGSFAKTYVVNSGSSFVSAHNAAEEGDTIIWGSGLYYDIGLSISRIIVFGMVSL